MLGYRSIWGIPSILVAVVLFLTGCVSTSVISKSGNVVTQKFHEVTVEWKNNPKMLYSVFKMGPKDKLEITLQEKVSALHILKTLEAEVQSTSPAIIQKKMAAKGITQGRAFTLQLIPVKSNYAVGGGRALYVRVSVLPAGSATEIWSMVIRVNGPKSKTDHEFANEFSNAVYDELGSNGWF